MSSFPHFDGELLLLAMCSMPSRDEPVTTQGRFSLLAPRPCTHTSAPAVSCCQGLRSHHLVISPSGSTATLVAAGGEH